MSKQVIIGIARHFGWYTLQPFVTSLQQTGYSGDTVIFGDKPELTEKMKQYGVTYIAIQNEYPFHDMFKGQSLPSSCKPMTWLDFSAKLQRYALAYLLLQQKAYEQVWLLDTRDVVFQQNPFDSPELKEELCVFEEADHQRYGMVNNHWHNNSVQLIFGSKWEILRDQIPICSGTTYGSQSAMISYLETMMRYFAVFADTLRGVVSDQAIHNYIIRQNLLPITPRILANNHGAVLTVSEIHAGQLQYAAGQILNKSNTPVNIIHQYDRLLPLTFRLCVRYWAWGYFLRQLRSRWRKMLQRDVIPFSKSSSALQ